MNCPICKNELEIKQKKVGENADGEIIYNEFAICHNCKKQWNLDKQRAKKKASAKEEQPVRKKKKRPVAESAPSADQTSKQVSDQTSAAPRPKKKRPVNPDGTPVRRKPSPEHPTKERTSKPADAAERPRRPKKRPAPSVSGDFVDFDRDDELEEIVAPHRTEKPTYSNIPPKHVREAREKEMRENYQNMLDEDDEEEGGAPIVLILIVIIILLAIAAFCGYWFILR